MLLYHGTLSRRPTLRRETWLTTSLLSAVIYAKMRCHDCRQMIERLNVAVVDCSPDDLTVIVKPSRSETVYRTTHEVDPEWLDYGAVCTRLSAFELRLLHAEMTDVTYLVKGDSDV